MQVANSHCAVPKPVVFARGHEKFLDAHVGLLETLHAKAADADSVRREEAMRNIPPYSHFKETAGREGLALTQAPDTLERCRWPSCPS